jgi:hypothetical protein
MHEEVWVQFDKTMEEANKAFELADKAIKEVADGKVKFPYIKKDGVKIPLTFKNRLRLIRMAFSWAKWMKL